MPAIKQKQKRKLKRLAIEVPIKLYKRGSKKFCSTKAALTKTKNFSQKGLYICSPKTYAVGTPLDIELFIKPEEKPLLIKGEVIWVADKKKHPRHYPGMGIEITHMKPEDKKAVADFLDKKLKSYRDSLALQKMYLDLKTMAAKLLELEERHIQTPHFKKVIESTVGEMDSIAHLIEREAQEVKHL